MNEEPTYEYVKGQGWVVGSERSRILGIHRVNLEFRTPKSGEFYFDLMDEKRFPTYESVFQALNSNWWKLEFDKDKPNLPRAAIGQYLPKSKYVVVTLGPK